MSDQLAWVPQARTLTEREAVCYSFFTFTLTRCGDELIFDVEVPTAQVDVLDAPAGRAETSRWAMGDGLQLRAAAKRLGPLITTVP